MVDTIFLFFSILEKGIRSKEEETKRLTEAPTSLLRYIFPGLKKKPRINRCQR